MWAYVFFLIHLEDVKTSDFTALELYVHKLVSNKCRNFFIKKIKLCVIFFYSNSLIYELLKVALENYDFFPMNRALCLTSIDTDSTESKIDELLNRVTSIALKQKEEVTLHLSIYFDHS